MYDIAKRFYELGFWNKFDVRKWVELRKLTAEQYTMITGEEI